MSKIAILVNNKSIELIVSDKSKKLEFPADTIQNQEILDSRKYTGLVTNFFNENNLRDESAVILLSQEIIYEKDISFKSPEEEEKEIMEFLNTIPFENKKIALVKIPKAETEKLIGTNKDLYSFLLDTCVLMKLQVEAVVPFKKLGEIDKGAVSWKVIPPLVEKINSSEPDNFLIVSSGYGAKRNNKKYFIAIFVGFLLVVLIFLAEFFLKSAEQSKNSSNSSPNLTFNISPSPMQQSSSSGEISISKDKLTIEILNGSGVAGQASEIRNQLLKLGYSIIETGNYEGTASAQTTVSFSDKVSSDVQDEITKMLKTDFSDVATIKYVPANFEVIITTGTDK
ncbi:MAG: LytR C-terminal domain-containing protein [Microgenomates group bacterium]|jgi:hypothetical protein